MRRHENKLDFHLGLIETPALGTRDEAISLNVVYCIVYRIGKFQGAHGARRTALDNSLEQAP